MLVYQKQISLWTKINKQNEEMSMRHAATIDILTWRQLDSIIPLN